MTDFTAAAGLLPPPHPAGDAARTWARPLVTALGDGLRALYLYGSVLRPGFDPRLSDVNLLFVVDALPQDRLEAFANAAGALARHKDKTGLRFRPVLLTLEQVHDSTDVFPIDFLDLAERRALLEGADALAAVTVRRDDLRRHCEYELRAKLVGVRQAYVAAGAAAGAAEAILARAAGGSATLYRHVLALADRPHDDAPDALAHAVAEAFGVDATALAAPFRARRAAPAPTETAARADLGRYVDALERLVRAIDAFVLA
jgi:predicted nucleotidyltransferase